MQGRNKNLRSAVFIAALMGVLSGCGGGGGSTASNPSGNDSPPDNDPPNATIQGIATPSSVAVVTATNAG